MELAGNAQRTVDLDLSSTIGQTNADLNLAGSGEDYQIEGRAKVSNLIRTETPISTAFGMARLETFKVNGRHRIRDQYGRVSLPDDATETPSASC